MKIGLIIDYFKPHVLGGAERSARELARALIARDHEVTILTPNYGAPSEEEEAGIRIHRYWFPRRVEPGRAAPGLWIKNPLYYWISSRAIARLAKQLGLEILHAQQVFVQVPTWMAARRLRLPCVATIRDLSSLCSVSFLCGVGRDPDHLCSQSFRRCTRDFLAAYYPRASRWFRLRFKADLFLKHADLAWRQRLLRRYAKLVFVSHGLKDEYLRHGFDASTERLAVVYNIPPDLSDVAEAGRPPDAWNLPPNAPVVVFAGRMTLGKGADVLLRAIPSVVERHPDVVFAFAGRPSPQVDVPPTVPANNVRVLGRVPGEQIHALLARARLLVLPSVWPEPLSSAVLEALAFGVPVIGTRRGGTPEQIVEGENGWLVEAGDPGALADRIAEALDDPDRLDRMSAKCRPLLRERFDPEKITAEMLAIYQAAIDEARAARRR